MNQKEVLQTAMNQSAIDLNCKPDDFCAGENRVVISAETIGARKYLKLPFFCNLVSYGSNVVASVDPSVADAVTSYINQYEAGHCFETPNLHVLNDELETHGMRICFMAEYFLPDLAALTGLSCNYERRLLHPGDFAAMYTPEWSNALCDARKHLDVLAVGAFEHGKLVGLAGCSADCGTMWQVGVDVLPEYRQQGIASALTASLALEVLQRGKVPFYCCAWSNIPSVRNALRSGFQPAWVEMTAKSRGFVAGMNQETTARA